MAFQNDPPVRQIITPADAVTGATRIVVGADTPPELLSYGAVVALLFYVVDVPTNLEVGYFFIALSNTLDTGTKNVLFMGQVVYPSPGVPSSATAANVKTQFQLELNDVAAFTTFKDYPVVFKNTVSNVQFDAQMINFFNGAYAATGLDFKNNPDNGRAIRVDPFTSRITARAAEPTINGNSVDTNTRMQVSPVWYTTGSDDAPGVEFYAPALASKARPYIQWVAQSSLSGTDNSFLVFNAANMTFRGTAGGNTALSVTGNGSISGTLRLGTGNQEIGQGVLAGAHSMGPSAGIGATETAVLTSASTTFYANRTYKVTIYGEISVSAAAAANTPLFRFRKFNATPASGQNLFNRRFNVAQAGVGYEAGHIGFFDIGASNVTTALMLTLTGSAAFTVQHLAGTTNPRGFIVEDCGSALNPALDNANIVTLT